MIDIEGDELVNEDGNELSSASESREGSTAYSSSSSSSSSSSNNNYKLEQVYRNLIIATAVSIAVLVCIVNSPVLLSNSEASSIIHSITDLRVPKATDEFVTGDIKQSNTIPEGKIENLIDLPVDVKEQLC